MTSAYILIIAMLLLGGLIAVLGDRLGSKVGKARLRLFNLRPRQTAVMVTVLTGTVISASTLIILFSLSSSLRQGVFELDEILKKRREVQTELEAVTDEKEEAKNELKKAKKEQEETEIQLKTVKASFSQTNNLLKQISQQANRLKEEISKLLTERKKLNQQRNELNQELQQIKTEVQLRDQELARREAKIRQQNQILTQLQQEQSSLQTEISQRDNLIADLDQAIATKDKELEGREAKLAQLEEQLDYLQREVTILEEYYQTYQELRARKIAIVRGQVLAFAAVRVVEPNATQQAIDQLLREANKRAIQATIPGSEETSQRVVQITQAQVQQLINQIKDGQDYVVRILSAGNYVQGEQEVRVFADVALNQKIFTRGEEIATVSIESNNMSEEDLQKRLDVLLAVCQFRARRSGILGDIQVEDGRIATLLAFLEKLDTSTQPIDEIRAIASDNASTVGPLKLRLVAVSNGRVIFSS